MKAIGKTIVIETIKEKETTESGLLLTSADTDKFRYKKGKVIMPGHECLVIKIDDIIFYDKAAGHTMMLNEKIYTIIQERDVVVVE
jgi:co-chaperonin GroES (HSP10)|tara:strand:+ start:182 stop:439 length:258 start_codon:yes stop_codon:yes gene_type:complete